MIQSFLVSHKFFSRIIGATSLIFTYLGEFLPKNRKDMVLGKLEIFWDVGMIMLPGKIFVW